MATTKLSAYGSIVSAHTTSLNSLANNANSAASSAIDNTTPLDIYYDFELVLGTQSTRTAGALVIVYLTPSIDGTNYTDVDERIAEVAAVFPLSPATTAVRAAVRNVQITPGLFKVFVRNQSGQAFAASGNTLKYRPFNIVTA